jgi:hypothetical protein
MAPSKMETNTKHDQAQDQDQNDQARTEKPGPRPAGHDQQQNHACMTRHKKTPNKEQDPWKSRHFRQNSKKIVLFQIFPYFLFLVLIPVQPIFLNADYLTFNK